MTYETVRETLARFNEVLSAAPPYQKKTLLQLLVREVRLSADRRVEGIEVQLDDSVNAHMISDAPSATGTEGTSPIPGQGPGHRKRPRRFSLTL